MRTLTGICALIITAMALTPLTGFAKGQGQGRSGDQPRERAQVERGQSDFDRDRMRDRDRIHEEESKGVDLSKADVIVSGGRGVGAPEKFPEVVQPLVEPRIVIGFRIAHTPRTRRSLVTRTSMARNS